MAARRQSTTKPRDGRSLDHKTLEQLRLERIEAGERVVDVARQIGFDQAVVPRWMSRYRKEGVEVLRSSKAPGPTPKLDDGQVALVRQIIVSTSPPVWHFPTVSWTRSMVGVLIEKGLGVSLSEGYAKA